MLIHNVDDSGEITLSDSLCIILTYSTFFSLEDNEHELRFTAVGSAPNGISAEKGKFYNSKKKMIFFIFVF